MATLATDPSALHDVIMSTMDIGNWELARAQLSRLMMLDPIDIVPDEIERLRHKIETALVSETDWKASANRWREALRWSPDETSLWPFAASSFIQAAEFVDADEVLRKLCEHQPDNFENWMYFALNAESQHRWSTAVERWDRVISLNPDDSNIKMLRGDAIWNAEMQAIDDIISASPEGHSSS